MVQARGRVRRIKEGLRERAPIKNVTTDEVEEEINSDTMRIVQYLRKELDVLLQSNGCHREVMQIGRALNNLRPKRPRDPPEDTGPAKVTGRDFFKPPPT